MQVPVGGRAEATYALLQERLLLGSPWIPYRRGPWGTSGGQAGLGGRVVVLLRVRCVHSFVILVCMMPTWPEAARPLCIYSPPLRLLLVSTIPDLALAWGMGDITGEPWYGLPSQAL